MTRVQEMDNQKLVECYETSNRYAKNLTVFPERIDEKIRNHNNCVRAAKKLYERTGALMWLEREAQHLVELGELETDILIKLEILATSARRFREAADSYDKISDRESAMAMYSAAAGAENMCVDAADPETYTHDRARACEFLAMTLRTRYAISRDLEDILAAAEYGEMAGDLMSEIGLKEAFNQYGKAIEGLRLADLQTKGADYIRKAASVAKKQINFLSGNTSQ